MSKANSPPGPISVVDENRELVKRFDVLLHSTLRGRIADAVNRAYREIQSKIPQSRKSR